MSVKQTNIPSHTSEKTGNTMSSVDETKYENREEVKKDNSSFKEEQRRKKNSQRVHIEMPTKRERERERERECERERSRVCV